MKLVTSGKRLTLRVLSIGCVDNSVSNFDSGLIERIILIVDSFVWVLWYILIAPDYFPISPVIGNSTVVLRIVKKAVS